MKKAVKAILNVLSYGGIEVESARRLADIKKLDPIRIFLRKLDMEIYNGDYKVPIRLFFPDEKYELPLYGNQWIPLGVKTTLQEKVRLSAALDKACNGGSIAHINIDKPFNNFDTAWKMLNYVADQGVVYFAFCTRISACEENHGFYGDTCPICGKPKVTTYQRIVGFLTPERTYSKERKAEFKMRDWMDLNAMSEM